MLAAITPLMLAAAPPAPEPLWEMVPAVPGHADPCALPPAQWGTAFPEGAMVVADRNYVSIGTKELMWNGIPIDEPTLRSYLHAVATLNPRPRTFLYGVGVDCTELQRVAALIDAESGCTPRDCIVIFDLPSPMMRPAPMPPAPPPPPPAMLKRASPRGSPQSWVTNDDYPPGAIWNYQQGTTGFRLRIDAAGRVIGCTVTSSSGSAPLDDATCTLLRRRARFYPAENLDGVKVESDWSSRFRWTLPTDRSPIASWAKVVRYRIDGSGEVFDCTEKSFGPAPDMFGLCRETDWNPTKGMGKSKWVEIRVTHAVDQSRLALPPAPGETLFRRSIRFAIDGGGDASDCRIVEEIGTDRLELNKYRCHTAMDYPPDEAARKPGRGVTYTISVTVTPHDR